MTLSESFLHNNIYDWKFDVRYLYNKSNTLPLQHLAT